MGSSPAQEKRGVFQEEIQVKSFDQQVADWARTKPADETYDYEDPFGCAMCLFLIDQGITETPRVIPGAWRSHWKDDWIEFSERVQNALSGRPFTFGALADRLSS